MPIKRLEFLIFFSMNKIRYILTALVLLSIVSSAASQSVFKPGFDASEYREVLAANSQHFDTLLGKYTLPKSTAKLIYRSPEIGMDNRWDYLKLPNNTGVISIRGTAPTSVSWLENFYAAMVPATGKIQNSDSTSFSYKLADDSLAYIHAGWLFGLSFMAEDIDKLMHDEYNKGVNNFIIVGHSQGGVMSMMLRSYLQYVDNSIVNYARIKVYASAAPKPGNLYYAYDFESITAGGWAYRIVNTADWVPQMPFSVQSFDDIAKLSPFSDYKALMKNTSWYKKVYVNHAYNKLNRRTNKLKSYYSKFLEDKAFTYVEKSLEGSKKPSSTMSLDYTVCGHAIILKPNKNYLNNYANKSEHHVFIHHHFYAYWLLTLAEFPERD